MILTKNSDGEWVQVAGNGKAEYGASTERKGDITVPATTAGNFQTVNVVFAQAMPDNDYTVVIDEGGNTWAHCTVNVTNKTATGFTLFFLNVAGADAPQMTFKYRAFKLYTDTEYNSLLEDVEELKTVTSGTGTLTSGINGTVIYRKCGRIVSVLISNVRGNTDVSAGTLLASGLPKPAMDVLFPVQVAYSGESRMYQVDPNGNLYNHVYSTTTGAGVGCFGTITYLTADD